MSVAFLELAPGAGEAAHTHHSEEVLAVVSGAVTVFLGAIQARRVGAGEIVRIPAGEAHRCLNRGPDPLTVVSARAENAGGS